MNNKSKDLTLEHSCWILDSFLFLSEYNLFFTNRYKKRKLHTLNTSIFFQLKNNFSMWYIYNVTSKDYYDYIEAAEGNNLL